MNKPAESSVQKAVDSIQQRITDYACGLNFDDLSPEATHAAKLRIIDTLGALMGGFFGEPCRIARNLAAQMPNPDGATVIGTRMKTTPDMAAFANATAGRYVELNDMYHGPGVPNGGHPSDMVTPILAAAEHTQATGRDYLVAVVLGYEIFLRISDSVQRIPGFDYTNYICLSTAVAAGKLMGLSPAQISHCVSMAVVPNITLYQVRSGHLSMFKAAAAGQAGRAGVFAALLARAGMEGPHLPYEGKAGWCNGVSRKPPFSLPTMGGNGTPFKVQDTMIKPRPACGSTLSSILAAEKAMPLLKNIKEIKKVTVEVYLKALRDHATGEHCWNAGSRETADHSIPYVVAATLMDGTVTPRSFDDAHLWNPDLRDLVNKIEVVENEEFTKAYERLPVMHHTHITIVTSSGERLVVKTGGDKDDLGAPPSDAQIEEKFRGLSEDLLGAKRVSAILDRFWHLEDVKDMAAIPPAFVLD